MTCITCMLRNDFTALAISAITTWAKKQHFFIFFLKLPVCPGNAIVSRIRWCLHILLRLYGFSVFICKTFKKCKTMQNSIAKTTDKYIYLSKLFFQPPKHVLDTNLVL